MKSLEERKRSGTIDNIISKEQDDKVSLSLPTDLIIEILTKLPLRSVCKLIIVSKHWSSIIQGELFNDMYLTRSLTRPLLLFQFHRRATQLFQYSFLRRIHLLTPITIPGTPIAPPVHGLICCLDNKNLVIVIGNPSTGQFLALPKVDIWTGTSIFHGYDQVNDLYKVFTMRVVTEIRGCFVGVEHQNFTLGAQKSWRMIECKYPHYPATQGICKNGVVYYGADSYSPENRSLPKCVVVCFDLRFEEFSLITLPKGVTIQPCDRSDLMNYNGKIALVTDSYNGRFKLWVLMDVNKQEWKKVFVLVPRWRNLVGSDVFRSRGTISTGELIFEQCYYPNKFFIIYYNPKENKATRVEFKGNGVCCAL